MKSLIKSSRSKVSASRSIRLWLKLLKINQRSLVILFHQSICGLMTLRVLSITKNPIQKGRLLQALDKGLMSHKHLILLKEENAMAS